MINMWLNLQKLIAIKGQVGIGKIQDKNQEVSSI